jgi:hypothetical protein
MKLPQLQGVLRLYEDEMPPTRYPYVTTCKPKRPKTIIDQNREFEKYMNKCSVLSMQILNQWDVLLSYPQYLIIREMKNETRNNTSNQK